MYQRFQHVMPRQTHRVAMESTSLTDSIRQQWIPYEMVTIYYDQNIMSSLYGNYETEGAWL
jgi:hypothetical protein